MTYGIGMFGPVELIHTWYAYPPGLWAHLVGIGWAIFTAYETLRIYRSGETFPR